VKIIEIQAKTRIKILQKNPVSLMKSIIERKAWHRGQCNTDKMIMSICKRYRIKQDVLNSLDKLTV